MAPTSADTPHTWKGVEGVPVLEDAGVVVGADGTVRIPYRWPGGETHVTRAYAQCGRCWWEPAGRALIPLGLERVRRGLAAHARALLIAEGESDTLALRAAYGGTEAGHEVRGIDVVGVPGARTWQPAWRAWVESYPLLYVLGDGDDAGRELNAAVKRDVPWARPVWLPEGDDVRAVLERGGPRALDPYLRRADEDAHLWAAFVLAHDLRTAEALLLGKGVRGAA